METGESGVDMYSREGSDVPGVAAFMLFERLQCWLPSSSYALWQTSACGAAQKRTLAAACFGRLLASRGLRLIDCIQSETGTLTRDLGPGRCFLPTNLRHAEGFATALRAL